MLLREALYTHKRISVHPQSPRRSLGLWDQLERPSTKHVNSYEWSCQSKKNSHFLSEIQLVPTDESEKANHTTNSGMKIYLLRADSNSSPPQNSELGVESFTYTKH